jgi:hypothetical protein
MRGTEAERSHSDLFVAVYPHLQIQNEEKKIPSSRELEKLILFREAGFFGLLHVSHPVLWLLE